MSSVDVATLRRFVALAGERLSGHWVILGGAVIPLLGGPYRATLDIDVAGPDDAGAAATNELLRIALELGLPVEAVNQSGAFFLREFPGWREQLDVIHRGPSATILVPDATLYVLLKLGRLSESDLQDSVARIRMARSGGGDVDRGRVLAAIAAEEQRGAVSPRKSRLSALRREVGAATR